jgi:hypothetical protein
MRVCPNCGAFYAASSSGFCHVDGTPLVDLQPDNEEWKTGQRSMEKANQATRNKQRRIRIRRIVLATMAMLLMTRVVYVIAVKSVVHTDDARPRISATQSESPAVSPEPSPTPDVSPTPSTFFKISVQVKFANGRSPEAVQIMLNGNTRTDSTDARGSYVFAGLAAGGNYTVTPVSTTLNFEPSSQVIRGLIRDELVAFSAFPHKESPTPTPALYKISGQIRTTNEPLPPAVQISLVGGKEKRTAVTNPDGYYVFEGLLAGATYVVTPLGKGIGFEPGFHPINKLEKDERADFKATIQHVIKPDGPIRDTKSTPAEVGPRLKRRPG